MQSSSTLSNTQSNSDESQLIEAELVTQLYNNLRASLSGATAVAVILMFSIWDVVDQTKLIIWFLIYIGITLLRALLSRLFYKKRSTDAYEPVWKNLFQLGVIASAISWSLVAVLFIENLNPLYQLVVSLALAGVCAGAVTSLSAQWKIMLSFVVPVLLVYITVYLMIGGVHKMIGFLSVAYMGLLVASGRRMYESLYDNVRLTLVSQNQAKQIMHSEKRFRDVTEATGEYLWETDIDGNYTFLTDKVINVKGYKTEDFLGFSPDKYMPEEDAISYKTALGKGLANRDIFSIECRNLDRNGNISWEHITGKPLLDSNNDVIGFRGSGSSITERKITEIALIATRKAAETASTAKSEFLATMSHEIRTPMNGVIGMTQLLSDTQLTNQQKSYVDVISQSGRILITVINDILDYSKIEAGKLELELISFNLQQAVDDVYKLMLSNANSKSIQLHVDMQHDCSINVLGDAIRFRQILLNLLGNAIKFTHKGYVRVVIECLELSNNETQIEVRIEDTGIGINKEAQTKLFTSFSQADGSTTRKYGGTGLGLAISRQLVELMGGDISVVSEENKGSTFSFKITMQLSAENSIDSTSKEINRIYRQSKDVFSEKKVLLVEDNTANQAVALGVLSNLGFNISIANNGLEAIAAYSTNNYDLILMDCQMPEMDGFEATRKIRLQEHEQEKHVPIIALTANAMEDDKQRCYDAGMDDYLCKPFDIDELINILNTWIIGVNKVNNLPQPAQASKPVSKDELIDFDVLVKLKNIMGSHFDELIPAFIEGVENYFNDLKSMNTQDNMQEIERFAHSIKSSSANIGAQTLAKNCAQLEEMTKTNALTDKEMQTRLDEIKSIYQQVKQTLHEWQENN